MRLRRVSRTKVYTSRPFLLYLCVYLYVYLYISMYVCITISLNISDINIVLDFELSLM